MSAWSAQLSSIKIVTNKTACPNFGSYDLPSATKASLVPYSKKTFWAVSSFDQITSRKQLCFPRANELKKIHSITMSV